MTKYRILIVEDNLTFAIRLEKALVSWGHEVLGIISNSEQAIRTIKSKKPDVVLMDVYIHGDLNGIEVVNAVQGHGYKSIFMTAEKDEDTFEAAMQSNGSSYLVKPFNMLTLKGAIRLLPKENIPNPSNDDDKSQSENVDIFFKKRNDLIKFNTSKINWACSSKNYCELFIDGKRHVLRMSLSKLLAQLPADNFMRIHKQYVIRLDAIEKIQLTNRTVFINDKAIPIGRKYKDELIERIKKI